MFSPTSLTPTLTIHENWIRRYLWLSTRVSYLSLGWMVWLYLPDGLRMLEGLHTYIQRKVCSASRPQNHTKKLYMSRRYWACFYHVQTDPPFLSCMFYEPSVCDIVCMGFCYVSGRQQSTMYIVHQANNLVGCV